MGIQDDISIIANCTAPYQSAYLREILLERAQQRVVLAEVVAPLRHAVRLVNHEACQEVVSIQRGQQAARGLGLDDALRREVEEFQKWLADRKKNTI